MLNPIRLRSFETQTLFTVMVPTMNEVDRGTALELPCGGYCTS
jgi:hypothetical protein